MDKKIVQSATAGLDVPATATKADDSSKTNTKKKGGKIFLFTLILIIVLVVAGFLVDRYTSLNLLGSSTDEMTLEDDYNAVFLSNGQVYFGAITKQNDDYTYLKDIYYLQVANGLQQDVNTDTTGTANTDQSKLTLVKLGNELHGPKDYMKINNQHIVFIEDLKVDGRVVEAIKQYKIDEKNAPAK